MATEDQLRTIYEEENFDIAFQSSGLPWPKDLAGGCQRAARILPENWLSFAARPNILNHYVKLAEFTCETPFGERTFHVWEHRLRNPYPRSPYRFAIVKPCSVNSLVVTCKLRAFPQQVTAEFSMLSGRCFDFSFTDFDDEITVGDIEQAAKSCALNERLLESRTQSLRLLFDGFTYTLPRSVCMWTEEIDAHLSRKRSCLEGPALQQQPQHQQHLEKWLSYLHALTFDELDELALLDSSKRLHRILGAAACMQAADYNEKFKRRSLSPWSRHASSPSTTDEP